VFDKTKENVKDVLEDFHDVSSTVKMFGVISTAALVIATVALALAIGALARGGNGGPAAFHLPIEGE